MGKCCVFAGQGAQVPGMGRDFAEADAEAMGFFDKANGNNSVRNMTSRLNTK